MLYLFGTYLDHMHVQVHCVCRHFEFLVYFFSSKPNSFRNLTCSSDTNNRIICCPLNPAHSLDLALLNLTMSDPKTAQLYTEMPHLLLYLPPQGIQFQLQSFLTAVNVVTALPPCTTTIQFYFQMLN